MTAGRVDAALRDAVARAGIEAVVPSGAGRRPTPGRCIDVRDVAELDHGVRLLLVDIDGVTTVAPIVAGGARIQRARPGDGAFEAIADLIRDRNAAGAVSPRTLRDLPPAIGERAIGVDQTNESVVVGERLVVKLFPQPGACPQPGEDLPAHLAAVGFTEIPEPFGSLRWDTGRDRLLLATVTAFLHGSRDGWAWFLDLALRAIDDRAYGPSTDAAERCGALVARFHAALATPSSVLGEPVGHADAIRLARWGRRARSLLDEAVAVTHGEEGARLAELAPRVRSELAAFDAVRATPVQRIHGDLHVGQVLRSADGDAITDLDGDPLAPPQERLAAQPAARDVASFARSLDHLARIAQRRLGASTRDADAWSDAIRRCFVDAYVATLDRAGLRHLYDERLRRPFEVAQACHEYVYAARFLPPWLAVADLALPALLREADR